MIQLIKDMIQYLHNRRRIKKECADYMKHINSGKVYNVDSLSELAVDKAVALVTDTLSEWEIVSIICGREEIEVITSLLPCKYSSIFISVNGAEYYSRGEMWVGLGSEQIEELEELNKMVKYDMFDFVFDDWSDEEIQKHYD